MAQDRFEKVFVFKNVGTELITTNTLRPHQLTSGQVGIHLIDQDEVIGVGTGATPAPTAIQRIQIHQNVGDTKFGTVRTKTINVADVTGYYKSNTAAAATEIWYLGYDEVDNTKDILVPCGSELLLNFNIFSKLVSKWYGTVPGYRRALPINTGCCPVGEPDASVDRDVIADQIVAQFNMTNARANDFPVGSDLKSFITATKVVTGTQGASDRRVGIKFESVAIAEDALNLCDPTQWFERELVTFTVSIGKECAINVPVTKTQSASPGTGWAAEVAAKEAESQGYDRVRENYENPRFMLTNYIKRATAGVKHDCLVIEYNWTHDTPGGHPQRITEPYRVLFYSPTTSSLQTVADVFNAWLTGRFAAITI